MRTTAELHGHIAHLDHTDNVAVLLAKHRDGALLLRFLDGQHLGHNGDAAQDRVIDEGIDREQLLGRDGLKVREVEAQTVGLNERTGLMHVIAEHRLERGVEQMRRGVAAADGHAAFHINGCRHGVAELEAAGDDLAAVHELAALVLLDVGDLKDALAAADHAHVADLAAHFGIEWGLVEYDNALHAAHHGLSLLALDHQRDDLRIVDGVVVIADKFGGRHVLAELNACPAEVAERLARLARAGLLLLHLLVEALAVERHALVLDHFDRQVDGEPIGVVELECVRAGEDGLALLLVGGEKLGEDLHTAVDGLGKVLFLRADDLGDIGLTLAQLGIVALVLVHDRVHDLIEERAVDTEELAMARGSSQQAAQHVAAALVAGQHAIADHEGGGADMVGDDAQGHVFLAALAVARAGNLGDLVRDVHHRVDIKEGVNVLAHNGKTLKAHAGIDVLLLELGVVVVAVVVELGEDDVPDLHIAVAVAADGAAGLAAAVLFAAVIVNFRAGTAGAGAVLPEVVFLAELEDAVLGNADLLVPDAERLVIGGRRFVAGEDGWIQTVGVKTHPLGAREEFPRPVDRLGLEIVAEREVAEHFKVRAVAGGVADVFNVAGADALLAGGHAVARRLLLTGEERLHRCHAGVDEQQRRVVLRDQGKAGQAQVAFRLKEMQEHFPQLVETVILGLRHKLVSPFIVKFLVVRFGPSDICSISRARARGFDRTARHASRRRAHG